jgi:hypothetical protein
MLKSCTSFISSNTSFGAFFNATIFRNNFIVTLKPSTTATTFAATDIGSILFKQDDLDLVSNDISLE